MLLNTHYKQLLTDLLHINCVTPMETDEISNLPEALALFKSAAESLGFIALYNQDPKSFISDDPTLPSPILQKIHYFGDDFYHSQPSLVLAFGSASEPEKTIMFNVHMDTVSPHLKVSIQEGKILGRGAVDMKGPAVAILAAIEGLRREFPDLEKHIRIFIQCVAGEEGGAMGYYGTKILTELGYTGRLNIFAEPTNTYFFDHATTSMTLAIKVSGRGVTDDHPEAGDNATVLLGFLADYFAENLTPVLAMQDIKMCIAGIHTGTFHNRVYGDGSLHINFAYKSLLSGINAKKCIEDSFTQACHLFDKKFRNNKNLAVTVKNLRKITQLQWIKSGLPVLANRDDEMERLLERTAIKKLPPELSDHAFTCDALWVQGDQQYTIVYGPGSLLENGAHTQDEFVSIADLEDYAQKIALLIMNFTRGSYEKN